MRGIGRLLALDMRGGGRLLALLLVVSLGLGVDKGDELLAPHEGLKHLRHVHAVRGLVVFNEAAQGALGGGKGRVEHVDM